MRRTIAHGICAVQISSVLAAQEVIRQWLDVAQALEAGIHKACVPSRPQIPHVWKCSLQHDCSGCGAHTIPKGIGKKRV